MSASDNENPNMPNGLPKALSALFGGSSPTPEDRVAECKLRQAEARVAIPQGEELLLKLREFEALTHHHQKLGPVRAVLAGLVEELRFDADHLDPDCSR